MSSFSVIVPSLNRPSLRRTVESFTSQDLHPADRMFIVFDMHEQTRPVWELGLRLPQHPQVICTGYDAGLHRLGVPQINWQLGDSFTRRTSHIMLLGDDDIYVRNAFKRLRVACDRAPLSPIFFQAVMPQRHIIPDSKVVAMDNVGGCTIAAPNSFVGLHDDSKLYPEHDFDWIVDIVRLASSQGYHPQWLEETLVVCRPDERTDEVGMY